jgi:hypothetical protein
MQQLIAARLSLAHLLRESDRLLDYRYRATTARHLRISSGNGGGVK